MPLTLVRGETQIIPTSINLSRLFNPFLTATEGDWDVTNGGNDYTITGIRNPTADQDAATKDYVDGIITGFTWKAPARACAPANINIATAMENDDVLDGVTLVTGDRVLLHHQTDGGVNEVQLIQITGTPTGGTFTLTVNVVGLAAQESGNIAYNANAATVESTIDGLLSGLTGWTNGDIAVTGTDMLSGLTLTYSGTSVATINQTQATIDISLVTGGTPVAVNTTSVEGERIGTENGVYIVQASGAGIRATDWPVGADASNFALFVSEGTECGDKAYVVTSNAPDAIIDTDGLVITQFAGAGQNAPTHIYSDNVTVTNGSPTVTLSNVPIISGTERVFLNGVRQKGGGEDYTIVASTGVITFTFNLDNDVQIDIVVADYDTIA